MLRRGERVEDGAGELEVGLRVLEADRVDLVRHGRGAGRAGLRGLPEVAERDVRPDVRAQVVQDAVGVRDAGVQLRLPVVRLDLRGERVPVEAEALHELLRDAGPVGVGVRDEVRREGAGRAAELAQVLGGLHLRADTVEAVHEDGELLAHRRRRRGLAVRAGEHGVVAVLHRLRAQLADDGAERGQPHLGDAGADRERVGEVVDVLAGRGEVRELGDVVEAEGVQALAHQVLDGLHVVLGGGLQLGEPVDLGLAELVGEGAQLADLLVGERGGAEHPVAGQVDEPLHLDLHARPVEARLRQVVAEAEHRGPVAAVQGAERLGRQGGHEAPRGIGVVGSPLFSRTREGLSARA
jgi:hypothetical protein